MQIRGNVGTENGGVEAHGGEWSVGLLGKLGRERERVGYHRVSIERRRRDDREREAGVVATLSGPGAEQGRGGAADRLQRPRLCHDDRAPGLLPNSGRSVPPAGQRSDPPRSMVKTLTFSMPIDNIPARPDNSRTIRPGAGSPSLGARSSRPPNRSSPCAGARTYPSEHRPVRFDPRQHDSTPPRPGPDFGRYRSPSS